MSSKKEQATELRRQAEKKAWADEAHIPEARSPKAARMMTHELRVHQIELEMQNEELREAQHELEAARARYFDLYDLAPVGYLTLSEKGLILEANLTFSTLLNVPRSALVKRPLSQVILKEDQGIYYLHRKALFETSTPQQCEIRMLKNGGEPFFWAQLDVTVAQDDDGAPVCRVILSDITEQKTMEEQLRQAQKLQSIGQLVAGIAHDFNNLMQVVNGCAELARGQIPPEHVAAKSIDQVALAGDKAKDLVKQLLAFSRQQVIEPVDLDLNEEIGNSQKMLRHMIGEHIQFEFVAAKDLGEVLADKGQIQQVLMNLCVNARDAMPNGGTLTIETKEVSIAPQDLEAYGLSRPGRYVLLSITDTGCGMDQATCEKLFEPFFTTKGVGKGTGLGLSTVYGIVKQHNGHITVYSEPGEGTTFKIYLPVSNPLPADGLNSALESDAPAEGGSETILVVEDDEVILKLATEVLNGAGYTALTAKDGVEAVRVFEEHADEIDLVMMDVVMPLMSGKEAMEEILKKRPALRYLFVSGYSPATGHNDFIVENNLHLLSKPYPADALLRKIREVLAE